MKWMQNKYVASGVRIVANAVIILAFGLLVYGNYLRYHASGSFNWLGLLLVNTIFVAMYVARRNATSISQSPALWLLAFTGTCMPLALRPTTAAASWVSAGNILQLIGLIAIAASLLSLRRSFGIVPANRGIRTQGIYNVVRHPLYASELFWMLGFAIANPSAWNILIWLCDCALQFTRACAEERFLSGDPVYLHYRARVRYRLVPLVL